MKFITQDNVITDIEFTPAETKRRLTIKFPSVIDGERIVEVDLSKETNKKLQTLLLFSVEFAKNIVRIGGFQNCPLKSVKFEEGTIPLTIKNGAFSNTRIQKLILPSNIFIIGSRAFSDSSLKSIIFKGEKSKLSSIQNGAFRNCTNLTSVTLPASDDTLILKDSLFEDCSRLKSCYLHKTNIDSLPPSIFKNCIKLNTVTIPNTLKLICRDAFFKCSSLSRIDLSGCGLEIIESCAFLYAGLKSINFPNTLTRIKGDAFTYCKLTKITLPEKLEFIGEGAFDNNKLNEITNIEVLQNVDISNYAFSDNDFKELNIPVLRGLNYAMTHWRIFGDNKKLTKVTFAKGTAIITANMFTGCQNLTDVTFPDTLLKIENEAFHGCNIQELTLPDELQKIGSGAFAYCGLTKITNIEKLENIEIGSYAFAGNCFTELTIPALKAVDYTDECTNFFSHNLKLTKVELADGTTIISKSMFSDCILLSEVIIPDSVTIIDTYAFNNCPLLNSFIFSPKLKRIEAYAFSKTGLTDLDFSKCKNLVILDCAFDKKDYVLKTNPYTCINDSSLTPYADTLFGL